MTKRNDEAADAVPRWVKMFGIAACVVVALFVALHLMGVAPHGH
jgi:hypothetical protein